MAFVSITDSEIEVGRPVKKELFQKIKDNLDDHETRIGGVESLTTRIGGIFGQVIKNTVTASSISNLAVFDAPGAMQILEAEIAIGELNGVSSGILEIDIVKTANQDLDLTGATSIFTTRPSIDFSTASNFEKSTNAVLNSNANLVVNDVLILSITSLPNGVVPTIKLKIEGGSV